MATHYAVLGVAPDASQEAIKRAYADLARANHPDRQSGRSPEERARAEVRMREVNAAWQVLRNPARRSRYDAELRGARPAWEQGPRPARTTPVVGGFPPPGSSPSGVVVPARAAPLFRFGPIVLIVVVLLGILVFTAYANYQQNVVPESATPTRPAGAPDPVFATGQCVVMASVEGRLSPVITACSTPGARSVTAVIASGRPCPAPATSFDLATEQTRLCLVPVPGGR